MRCFNLTEQAEEQDPTCRPVLGYGRSLLHLVSNSFEGGNKAGRGVPILGMQIHLDDYIGKHGSKKVKQLLSPNPDTGSTMHGGFDDDDVTMRTVIRVIKTGKV